MNTFSARQWITDTLCTGRCPAPNLRTRPNRDVAVRWLREELSASRLGPVERGEVARRLDSARPFGGF